MFLGKLEWNSHLQFATLGNSVQNILGSVRENVITMSFPQLSSPSISLGHSTSIWVSLYFLTSWPLFPMIYLIFKMFDLFRSWPLQKRSKTKELWLWFLTFFVEVKNERGQTFWKLDKSLGKEVKRSKDKMKNLKQKKFLKNLKQKIFQKCSQFGLNRGLNHKHNQSLWKVKVT